MNHRNNKMAARAVASAFAAALAESLTQIAGTPFHSNVLDNPQLATRKGQTVHFRLTADGALQGECFVELYEPQVAELASKFLGRPLAPFSDEQVDALSNLLSSAMAGFSASLTAEFGEVAFNVERTTDLAFGGMLVVPLTLSEGENAPMPLLLYFDGKLMEGLSQRTSNGATDSAPADPTNLKLVMDVELNVSLRFGQRQLPLREVLELTSGSVIELDRQVDEPVELLLDGKVIARGEAVIVDGNYGLRITEVPQPIASQLTY